jgi:hypothetical protein
MWYNMITEVGRETPMTTNDKSAILSTREIAERGKAIYKAKWEEQLLKTSAGKFVAIDVRTGDASVADTSEDAIRAAEQKNPQGYFHLIRVGHKAAFAAGWFMSHAS